MPDYLPDLASTIPWERALVEPKTIHGDIGPVSLAADYAPLANLGEHEWNLIYWDNKIEAKDVIYLRAKKFVELVKDEGLSPNAAAAELCTSVEVIKKTRGGVEESVRTAIETYGGMPPEIRKAWVRAEQNKLLIKASEAASNSDDPKLMEIALKISNSIADDCEVGITNKKPTVAIVNQPTLPPALAALVSATELPEGIVLEGETEDITPE